MTACPNCPDTWNAALDARERPFVGCPACVALAAEVGAFRSAVPAVPTDFANRAVRAALRDRRERRRLRFAVACGGAMAASVILFFAWPRPPLAMPDVAKVQPLAPQFDEASRALVSLTRKTTDEAFVPAGNLFAVQTSAKPTPAIPVFARPAAMKAGDDPLTRTATRAVQLFVRDLGTAASLGKTKS